MDRLEKLTKMLAEEFGITSSDELDRRLASMQGIDISPFTQKIRKKGLENDQGTEKVG